MAAEQLQIKIGADVGAAVSGLKQASAALNTVGESAKAADLTWKEFVGQRMGAYMKQFGSHGAAIKQIAIEWKDYKASLAGISGVQEQVAASAAKMASSTTSAAGVVEGLTNAFARISSIDVAPQLEAVRQKIFAAIDQQGGGGIEVPITPVVNPAPAIKSLQSLENELEELRTKALAANSLGDFQKLAGQFGILQKEADKLNNTFRIVASFKPIQKIIPSSLVEQVQTFGGGVRKVIPDINTLGRSTTGVLNPLSKLKGGSGEATQALINLSRVAQDAPYGFIGIANNLNPLLESFQRLKTASGTTGGALKALSGELMGAGGIGLALGVVSSLLVVFGDKLFGAGKAASAQKDKIEGLKKAFDELKATTSSDILGGAGSEFAKAVSAIETLRENVNLAKKGFIDKKEVVAQYNKELGDTIGNVQTLDEVEKAIASKGDAYLRFTLLKAAAQEALKKASEAALTAAQNEAQANEVSTNAFVQGSKKLLQGFGATTAVDNINKSVQKSTKGFQKNVNDANKQKDRFVNIFKDFQDQAAKIAQQNNFNFTPSEIKTPDTTKPLKKENEKLKDTLEERKKILTEFQKDFEVLKLPLPNLSMDLEKFSIEGLTDELRDKLGKALLQQPLKLTVPLDIQAVDPKKVPRELKMPVDIQWHIDQNNAEDKKAEQIAKERLQTIQDAVGAIATEAFSSIGEALGTAISGGDFGKVFQNLFSFIGGAIAELGKRMIAISPVIAALKAGIKSLNPAILLPAGIALVAIGTALRGATVKGFAKGGFVGGTGSGDTVPAMLTPGEFVVTKDKAPFIAELLKLMGGGIKLPKMINSIPHFADGGFVPNAAEQAYPIRKLKRFMDSPSSGISVVGGELRLQGRDLVAALSINQASQKRNFGR